MVELLTVITVIAIVSAASASVIPSLFQSSQVDGNVSNISGIFEQAREAAISGNTFVYVVFTGPLTTSGGGVGAAILASQDGTDSLNNFAVTGAINSAATSNLQVLRKVQTLPGISLLTQSQAEALGVSNLPTLTSAGTALQTVNLTLSVAGTSYAFTQAVEFKPDGEACVSTWNDLVEFGIQATHVPRDNAVVRLTRLTGKLSVYRQ